MNVVRHPSAGTERFLTAGELAEHLSVSTLQAHGKGGGYRIDAESAAGGHLIPVRSFAQNQRGELRESEIASQLTAGGGKPGEGYPAMRAGSTVRRLTPVECERLMSWPDGWTAIDGPGTPDGRRYAACGDGVVSNVSEWIGRRIVAVDQEEAEG